MAKVKNSLTPEAIASIIDSCARANVRVIDVPGLRLEFGEGKPTSLPPANSKATEPTTLPEAAISEMHDKQNQETLELEEMRLKLDQLRDMQINNPLEAEKLIASGELEEMAEGGNGDEDFD